MKVNESTSRTVPSTETKPRLPSSLIVTDPVLALTSNSVKSIAVAPPTIDVKFVPVIVVPVMVKLPLSVVLSARVIADDPESITMFPVVVPPRVSVCILVVARLPAPVMYVLFAPLFADIEAVGTPVPVLFVKANLADDVDVEPNNTSTVEFEGDSAPRVCCQ